MSLNAPRFPGMEVGLYPFRHVKRVLTPEELGTLFYQHDSSAECKYVCNQLEAWDQQHVDIAYVGGDGGVEMHLMIVSFYNLGGELMGGIVRKAACDYDGLVKQLGVEFTANYRANGKVRIAIIDRAHSKRATKRQSLSGSTLPHTGSCHGASGCTAAMGMPIDVLRPPDPMSEKTADQGYSSASCKCSMAGHPHIDSFGVFMWTLLLGTSYDVMESVTLSDIERML